MWLFQIDLVTQMQIEIWAIGDIVYLILPWLNYEMKILKKHYFPMS